MAMLLRTRKIALSIKVTSIILVTATYTVFSYFRKKPAISEIDLSDFTSHRHLLALTDRNCTPAALNEFPSDGFTQEERQKGWILLHVSISLYLFVFLAIICDNYFVPAIKTLCENMGLRQDVAGATFMAIASSSPELFINCIGTFVTEGDIGVGTIVGSAVFNILAVPACCGIFGTMVIYLDWWPVSRDCIVYGVSVILLITFLQDGKIYLHEAFSFILVYAIYILIMFFNEPLMSLANRFLRNCRKRQQYHEILVETTPLLTRGASKSHKLSEVCEQEFTLKDCEDLEESIALFAWPKHKSIKSQIWWVFTWPIVGCLRLTTPDCRRHPKLFPFTFAVCIIWIGLVSYLVSWLITAIGDCLSIPDSVMGLTFLAAGMSVPEAVSSILVTNQGYGAMGLSSSIASNSFDILLCLGIPWFIKTGYYPKIPGMKYIKINSTGLTYSAITLLSTLLLFYIAVALNKFKLDWKIGVSCLGMYIAFLVLASLIELNVFFAVNLPTC